MRARASAVLVPLARAVHAPAPARQARGIGDLPELTSRVVAASPATPSLEFAKPEGNSALPETVSPRELVGRVGAALFSPSPSTALHTQRAWIHCTSPGLAENWKNWVTDAAGKEPPGADGRKKGQPRSSTGAAPPQAASWNKAPQSKSGKGEPSKTDGSKSGSTKGSRGRAKATVAAQSKQKQGATPSKEEELKQLESILGLDKEDEKEIAAKGSRGVKGRASSQQARRRKGGLAEEGEEELEEEEEADEVLGEMWGIGVPSAEDQLAALAQSGKLSEEAVKAIKVVDLDSEGTGEGEQFKLREDRLYYPGQMYSTEELDFTKPLPEETVLLSRRQYKDVNSKEILRVADFRNVKVLSQFISPTAKILPRHKTKLSAKTQRKVAREIRISRAFGLMPFTRMGQPPFRFRYAVDERDNLESLQDQVDLR